jgi:hypothetical protein
LFYTAPRTIFHSRTLVSLAATLLALTGLSGCKDTRDKIKNRLYPAPGDGGWPQDSAFLASNPPLLFRVVSKGGLRYALPISSLSGGLRNMHLSPRGWRALDSDMMWGGKQLTPLRDARLGAPITVAHGMWENPTYPLDSARGCDNQVPIAQVDVGPDVHFMVDHFKMPNAPGTIDNSSLQQALDQVPTLVTPALGVSGAMLTRYRRSLHEISRAGASPSLLLEYNDPDPVLDTGSIRGKRPRQLIVIMDKGTYGFKPTWVYKTTRMKGDMEGMRYLDALDTNGDGKPELLFTYSDPHYERYTLVFRQWNDTWRKVWEHNGRACD